jgi:hypothetical protein
MPYRVTAVRYVSDPSVAPEKRLEEERVLADVIDDVTEPLARETAYRLAVEAGAEHVLLTPLAKDGKGWRPNADPNALTRKATTMFRTHDDAPVRVWIERPAQRG